MNIYTIFFYIAASRCYGICLAGWYVLDNAKICERRVVLLGSWKMQKEVQAMECCSYGVDVDRLEREREKQEGLLRVRI